MTREKYEIKNFEPAKVKNELYGKTIQFNHKKRYIKFTSEFHDPGFIYYDQIKKMKIEYDNKRKLLWFGILTFLLIIGIFILFVRNLLPPWHIVITLKKDKKPISIRARLNAVEAKNLADFCTQKFPVVLILKKT